ncbi:MULTISPECIES: type II toxin-antitoxin system RelE/ParE family toxin [unclassified Thiocapsa]|uniref:type II toxin-antitoxin system RelE/ParE family toxin n=1 Tax=unclassified Thiocapsa TaxID=2641286 RepID=UPI0035AF3382
MAWRIELVDDAKKDLAKLDKPIARRITAFLRERIATLDDPRTLGESLKGTRLGQLWKYRVGDYRIIASIEDRRVCVMMVRIGHRREVNRG